VGRREEARGRERETWIERDAWVEKELVASPRGAWCASISIRACRSARTSNPNPYPNANPNLNPHPDQEREDEFDNVEVTHDKKVEDDKKLIDIVTRERSEVAHVPDADDDDEELLFIPTHPEPDEEGDEGGGGGEGDEADSSVKANKRKPATEGGKPVKRAA